MNDRPAPDRLDPARLDALWNFDDPAATAERFATEARSASPVTAAELDTQRARALGLAGRGSEADALLDAIEPVSPVVEIRLELERGRRLNSSGNPSGAVRHFARALELARSEHEDFLAVDAAHMLAIADAERASEWGELGLRIVQDSTDARTKRWAIALANNLGWTLHDAGRFDEALERFEAADAASRAVGTEEQQQLAQWAIARCYRSLGRTTEARAIQERLAVLRPDDEYVLEELALLIE